ncbi:hypothetical protein [Maioricimonas sp. JC845]|uniref:hypothetical protein n=1 Tax=Maioricimonas sp. JC845 TaxID=3232138 RepID=UPI003458C75E
MITATSVGMGIVIVGLIIELIAFAALAHERVRERLRIGSPMRWQAVGFVTFYVGAATIVLGKLLGWS